MIDSYNHRNLFPPYASSIDDSRIITNSNPSRVRAKSLSISGTRHDWVL